MILFASVQLNGRLGHTERIDALVNDGLRLFGGLLANQVGREVFRLKVTVGGFVLMVASQSVLKSESNLSLIFSWSLAFSVSTTICHWQAL